MASDIGTKTTAGTRLTGIFLARLWTWPQSLLGDTARKTCLSLIDQAVVSGTRFLTTVIVGRMCGAEELGAYALGFSVVVLVTVLQESLITTPYIIFSNRQSGSDRREHAGSVLVHHAMLAALATSVLAVVGTFLSRGIGPPEFALLTWVLAATMPFALLREFGRRFAFAHLRVVTALALDIAVAAIQLGGLLLVASTDTLSAATAFVVLGFTCAVASFAWLVLNRKSFAIRRRRIAPQLAHNCSFGKWLCGSQLVAVVSNSSIYWLLSILISTTATGVYAACWTVVLLANPFIMGLGNVVQPKTAHVFAADGKRELVRVVRKVTLVLSVFLAVFGLLVFLFGEQIVAWLYDDPAFSHQGHTITVLTISMIIGSLGMGYGHGLKAMERPQWNFGASLLNLSVMLLTAVPLAWSFGMVGGAYCLLSGSIAGTVTRYLAFSRLASG